MHIAVQSFRTFFIFGANKRQEAIIPRPKDVIRVEYYSNATDKFPNEENVVNFIIRKYESGGYVDVRTETSFLNEKGDYKAIVSVDRKKMNYTVQIGTNYQHDHAKGMESEEDCSYR